MNNELLKIVEELEIESKKRLHTNLHLIDMLSEKDKTISDLKLKIEDREQEIKSLHELADDLVVRLDKNKL